MLSLGSLLANLGRWPEAFQVFRDLVKRTPQSADAWFWLALSAGEISDFMTASDAFAKARDLAPEHHRLKPIAERLEQLYQEYQRAHQRSGGP